MSSKKNLYIVVDGLGGVGKGTVLTSLRKRFLEEGYRVVSTFEPGGTPEADKLRAELFARKGRGDITPVEELDYVFAARAMNMAEVVLPALASEDLTVVLKDRDYLSSFVYQIASGASRDLLMEYYRKEYEARGFPRPNLRLLMLLSPVEAMRRRLGVGHGGDGFDMQPSEYWRRVSEGYYVEAMDIDSGRGLFRSETVMIDAKQSVEAVCDRAWFTVVDRLGLESVEGQEARRELRSKGWLR